MEAPPGTCATAVKQQLFSTASPGKSCVTVLITDRVSRFCNTDRNNATNTRPAVPKLVCTLRSFQNRILPPETVI